MYNLTTLVNNQYEHNTAWYIHTWLEGNVCAWVDMIGGGLVIMMASVRCPPWPLWATRLSSMTTPGTETSVLRSSSVDVATVIQLLRVSAEDIYNTTPYLTTCKPTFNVSNITQPPTKPLIGYYTNWLIDL